MPCTLPFLKHKPTEFCGYFMTAVCSCNLEGKSAQPTRLKLGAVLGISVLRKLKHGADVFVQPMPRSRSGQESSDQALRQDKQKHKGSAIKCFPRSEAGASFVSTQLSVTRICRALLWSLENPTHLHLDCRSISMLFFHSFFSFKLSFVQKVSLLGQIILAEHLTASSLVPPGTTPLNRKKKTVKLSLSPDTISFGRIESSTSNRHEPVGNFDLMPKRSLLQFGWVGDCFAAFNTYIRSP